MIICYTVPETCRVMDVICYIVSETWHMTHVIYIFHFGIFFAFLRPAPLP